MKYYVIAVLIFCIALEGCGIRSNDSQIVTLDLTNKPNNVSINLNEYVTDVKIIRLETNDSTLIRYFAGHVGEKYIITVDYDKVLLFTSTGEYIRTITKKGKGPEEFSQIDAWTVDENETHFLFHDVKKSYIYNFNLNSQQFEKNIPFEDHGYLSNMILMNDTIISILPGMFTEYGYLFFNQTISGRITGGIVKENTPHPGAWVGRTPIFKRYPGNSIIFQPSESDTLFKIDGTKMIPIYALLTEKPQKSGYKTTGSSVSYLFSDKNRLLLAKYGYESIITPASSSMRSTGQEYLSFDLKTMQTSKIDLFSLENMDLEFDNAFLSFPNNNLILITCQAMDFKEMIDKEIKKADITESKIEWLKKLNSEIDENDNPILITGKWK